tara:strand:- start:14 stop:517 length:504 start_codon:yes stop_codon:yes gene_type:complete
MNSLFKLNIISFSTRNTISFVLLIASFILLYLGVTEPLLAMRAELLGNELFNFKRSILGATEQLYKDGFYLVAFLIFFFSIMIPVLKGLVVLWVFGFGTSNQKRNAHNFVFAIGRWSMADVFAVGVFIGYLAGQAATQIDSVLHPGFYYFTGYCLVSLLSLQVKSKL